MSATEVGCETCRRTQPDQKTTDLEDGSRIITARCPLCQYVWLSVRLTRPQVIAMATGQVAPALLRRYASVIEGSSPLSYQQIIDEAETIHGPEVAHAMRTFLAAVRDSESASLGIRNTPTSEQIRGTL